MRVYVDTSFLKQIVYRQEDARTSVRVLSAAERGVLDLRVPVVCVLEASRAVVEGDPARRAALARILDEVRRAERVRGRDAERLQANLADSRAALDSLADREAGRFLRLRDRLTAGGFLIPLSVPAHDRAVALELPPDEAAGRKVGYGPLDAAVVGTVLADLAADPPDGDAFFVTDDRRLRDHPLVRKTAAAAGLTLGRRPDDLLRQLPSAVP